MRFILCWVRGYGNFAKPFEQIMNHPEAKKGGGSRFSAKFSHVYETEWVGLGCPVLEISY